MEEVLVYGSKEGISAADLHSGTHLGVYKSSETGSGVEITSDRLFVTKDALLKIYTYSKEKFVQSIVLPERLDVIRISRGNDFLAGGTHEGTLYIWELASGELVVQERAHYQGITSIDFSADDAMLATAGADSQVQIWSMLELLSDVRGERSFPHVVLKGHTAAVTDVKISTGPASAARIYTCCADKTVRVWSLLKGTPLLTFALPEPVTKIVVDHLERGIYACVGTSVRFLSMYRAKDAMGTLEAVGAVGQILSTPEVMKPLFTDGGEIESMALSLDGLTLVTGSANGTTTAWDVATGQIKRKFRPSKGGVSYVKSFTRPRGEVSEFDLLPQLQRRKTDAEHDVRITLKGSEEGGDEDYQRDYRDLRTTKETSDSGRVKELESDLKRLYSQYEDLKSVHEELWKLHKEQLS